MLHIKPLASPPPITTNRPSPPTQLNSSHSLGLSTYKNNIATALNNPAPANAFKVPAALAFFVELVVAADPVGVAPDPPLPLPLPAVVVVALAVEILPALKNGDAAISPVVVEL